jgi:hypothetical protein
MSFFLAESEKKRKKRIWDRLDLIGWKLFRDKVGNGTNANHGWPQIHRGLGALPISSRD